MLTLLSRPQGHKLSNSGPTGSVSQSGGEALVTTTFAHGLVDGDWIYVESIIQSYNGFLQIDQTAYNQFKMIRRGTVVPFRQLADITYRVSVLDHGFQAVHNPIVYELETDLYPNNEADTDYTPVTVVSISNEGGYTRLALSSGIALLQELDYIRVLSGTAAGVHQVTRVFEQWNIVIDRLYSASDTYGQVVREYKNYTININLYAGLPADHPWVDEKPFELAASLKFTPDSNNKIKFSVSNTLRGYITTRNNLLLDTLPNNLDFITGFYIDYFESYDKSDGATITTQEGDVTTDDFIGYALNAEMPFKSGSFMNDYINFDAYLAKWLVLNPSPLTIVGRFFDMSFIISYVPGSDPGFTPSPLPELNLWGIANTSTEPMVWTVGIANPFCTISSGVSVGGLSDYLRPTGMTFEEGRTYKYNFNMGLSASISGAQTMLFRVHVVAKSSLNVTLVEATFDQTVFGTFGGTGSVSGDFEFVCPSNVDTIGIVIEMPNGTAHSAVATLTSFTDLTTVIPPSTGGTFLVYDGDVIVQTIENPGIGIIRVPFEFETAGRHCIKVSQQATEDTDEFDITETICVTVLDECDNTLIQSEDIRLLEDGDFRLLE